MNYYNGFISVVQKVKGKYQITIVGFLEVLNEVKRRFVVVPRTGFEPVTYGLEICWFIEKRIKYI